jgi:hypothetical protein
VRLYEIRDQAEPEKGYGLKAEAWRTLLETGKKPVP